MKVLEKPVTCIETATELKPIQVNVGVLLKTLKHVHENSNFYKEARIVSFTDRLMTCVVMKLKSKVSMRQSVMSGRKGDEEYSRLLESAKSIIVKFKDAYFI